jgi:ABC-type transport system involved in cytochrome c biogenesis permease subunit
MRVAERTMATSEITRPDIIAIRVRSAADPASTRDLAGRVIDAFASLKLTVALFALSIFLVFAGTLAQVDHGVWDVVRHSYFHVWIAGIDWNVFEHLAHLFYPVDWHLTGGFYFPGGKTIGVLLFANLLAAHLTRFKIAAQGPRLWAGWAIIALGALITLLVIRTGRTDTVDSELAPVFCDVLWQGLRLTLACVAVGGAYLLMLAHARVRPAEWRWMLGMVILLAALAVWLFLHPAARLDNSDLRILWRLTKGLAAGVVLLIGCVMVFRKRAGIALLHAGVALIMFSELLTAMTANESQMTIAEGQTVSYGQDLRTTELALTDREDKDQDRVTVVPQDFLIGNVGAVDRIDHADLPVSVQVHRWLANSVIKAPQSGTPNPATAGTGLQAVADAVRQNSGVDKDAMVDQPAAYVELFSKPDGKSLGTYLVAAGMPDQTIDVGGHQYDLSLRLKRIYEPYSLTLKKFRFDRYTGTNTPKNYSSLVQLTDPAHNVDREIRIWMNNPLRYAGTTIYQADFDHVTEKGTVLQVVQNANWMIPYVGCMLVATGMLAHFGAMLTRFLRRRADEAALASRAPVRSPQASVLQQAGANRYLDLLGKWFPAIVVAFFAIYLIGQARMPTSPPSEMQIYQFAKLPLAYQGRIKPYDTMACNTLQILSGRQEVIVNHSDGTETRLPAIRWLLDAISGADAADEHRVFRIDNLQLLQSLGLEARPGVYRYSLNEIRGKLDELDKQIKLSSERPEDSQSHYDKAVLSLAKKLHIYGTLIQSFRPPELSTDRDKLAESLQAVQQQIERLRASDAPHAVPPRDYEGHWMPLMEAEMEFLRDRAAEKTVNPATELLATMLDAYARDDVTTFNRQLSDYRAVVADYERSLNAHLDEARAAGMAASEMVSQSKTNFEVFYNHFSPFYRAIAMYVFAFILGALAWLGWSRPLRQASIALLCLTFALHTFALLARIYISGRPPVTNLYSSAVFIGWACVLLALVFESLYGLGLGNIVAAVIGFLTLLVAHFLSLDGDTFTVLQAVLDTQFWLATHVVCETLGYATTYLAGTLGIIYVAFVHVRPTLDENQRRQLARMTYGTLCFAIFFSFVGTVLGGLWGDNSWGRFWGWDPKENGALIIVLYNALVLHARWGALVGNRGLALLAIGGNIVTTWSYFGVNALGVGLHAYGGNDSSTAMWLLTFTLSQAALLAIGALPQNWWRFFGSTPKAA